MIELSNLDPTDHPIITYVLLGILAYYYARFLFRKIENEGTWGTFLMCLVAAALAPFALFIMVIITLVHMRDVWSGFSDWLTSDRPKWL